MTAFNPEDGRPARLIRYVPVMPLRNMLTLYFHRQNLLLIDKEHWERLDDTTRHLVLRTEDECLNVNYPPNRPPVVTPRGKHV